MKIVIKKEVSEASGKDIYVIYKDNYPIDLCYTEKEALSKFEVVKQAALNKIEPIIIKSEEI